MENINQILREGDWVKGVGKHGELIHGFVVKFDIHTSKLTIKVVQSDNELIIGKVVRLDQREIKKIEPLWSYSEKELEALIDLALSSRDEAWFIKLTDQLMKQRSNDLNSKGNPMKNSRYQTARE
ncbi:gamma-glutamylcyclotransferase (GGCT)/AIG2-like uncharacterized protein YtfP [Salirhabdus euzebyi]|uniref:Gamma-glutamylcyclotransferase (GGCT)/AIG2-like uncharacterized protein YtfP n=1 Tax=Salirhabdus euzebyi TaxID=394506 RepID=A0A841PUD0_9BACI|nr:IDEAL domain-containing protein [Salirhabdus euzebyi]MBB6452607.1 gamma-glutamylcyclotransferase (GGCT)/AIG2-like uncharacterized protein YtfP [Salirhabdus euzebyi]